MTIAAHPVTAAKVDLKRWQNNRPPWRDLPWSPQDGTERAVPDRLMAMLPTLDKLRFLAQMHGGDLAVGEIGLPKPNAEMKAVWDDGSASIMIYSGLIDFVHSVSRILFAGSNLFLAGGKQISKSTGISIVSLRLAELYGQWRSGALWKGQRLKMESFDLDDGARNRAVHLAHTTLLFFLCHEIGHAVLHRHIPIAERTASHEHEADAYGLALAIQGYGLGRNDMRMAAAGAMLAIRILAALELLGHKFPGLHPLPTDRLNRLRRIVRRVCASRGAYFSATTIAYSFDEMMESAELHIQGRTAWTELTDERLVSRLYSMLIEFSLRQLELGSMQKTFTNDIARAAPALLKRAGRGARMTLSEATLEVADSRVPAGGRTMAQGLAQLLDGLSPEQREIFWPKGQ